MDLLSNRAAVAANPATICKLSWNPDLTGLAFDAPDLAASRSKFSLHARHWHEDYWRVTTIGAPDNHPSERWRFEATLHEITDPAREAELVAFLEHEICGYPTHLIAPTLSMIRAAAPAYEAWALSMYDHWNPRYATWEKAWRTTAKRIPDVPICYRAAQRAVLAEFPDTPFRQAYVYDAKPLMVIDAPCRLVL